MERWRKMVFPLQRLCSGVASRFRFRNTGLVILHEEVKACEYEDVHIMWEMLNKSSSSTQLPAAAAGYNTTSYWTIFRLPRLIPCLGASIH